MTYGADPAAGYALFGEWKEKRWGLQSLFQAKKALRSLGGKGILNIGIF